MPDVISNDLPEDWEDQVARAYAAFDIDALGGADELGFGKWLERLHPRGHGGVFREKPRASLVKVKSPKAREKVAKQEATVKERERAVREIPAPAAEKEHAPPKESTDKMDALKEKAKADMPESFTKPLREAGELIREGVAEENWEKAVEDTVKVAEGFLASEFRKRAKNHRVAEALQRHMDRGVEAQRRLAVWFQVHENHSKLLKILSVWAEETHGGLTGGTLRENPSSIGGRFEALGLGNPFIDPIGTVQKIGQLVGPLISTVSKGVGLSAATQPRLQVARDTTDLRRFEP